MDTKGCVRTKNREIVTWDLLNNLGIDSLKITKQSDKCFKITIAETGAYEKFKIDNMENILSTDLKKKPYFRPELVQQLEE